jgi:hypothetical protein
MRLWKILTTLALSGAFAFITASVPSAFAQSANLGQASGLTAPNNDAGSGGNHAPGTKIAGPHEPANLAPRNGSAKSSTTLPLAAGSANPDAFSSSTASMTAKPVHPQDQQATGELHNK